MGVAKKQKPKQMRKQKKDKNISKSRITMLASQESVALTWKPCPGCGFGKGGGNSQGPVGSLRYRMQEVPAFSGLCSRSV